MNEFLDEVLLEAAKDGNLTVLKTALEKGADINAKTSDGKTALMVAIEMGHTELVSYLTEKGADVSIEKKTEEIKPEELEDTPNPNWKIVFERIGQGIMVMNADGSGLINLLDWGEMPDVSPDGNKIVFSFDLDIYLMDINGTNIKRFTFSEEMGSSFPKFSPNGKKIGFKRTKENKSEIWMMNIDGKNIEQLTYEKDPSYFCWTPNGKIAFQKVCSDIFPQSFTIIYKNYTMDLNRRNIEEFSIFKKDEYEPVWDSVGEKIAFCKGSDLFVMDKDGKNKKSLTEIKGWIGGWSPDNQWIVFSSRKLNGNGADIFIIRKDGKYECRLTNLIIKGGKSGGDFDPCWLSF